MISPTGKDIRLPPVRANYALELQYRRKLDALIDEMSNSILYWIGAAWKKRQPELAALANDDSPARGLQAVFRRLATRWQRRFDDLAPEMATWFATKSKQRSDLALKASLRKAGFTVRFRTTRAVNDVLQAAIAENVSLIRSISSEYLMQVEGHVMRAVQQGRDLGPLATTLREQYGVTKRRAALISRDQANKASAVIARVRQQELGITQAVWVHSAAGKEPRPSHVKAGRQRVKFDLAKGWYDPDVGHEIWPGELINCRCVSSPVIPGFR